MNNNPKSILLSFFSLIPEANSDVVLQPAKYVIQRRPNTQISVLTCKGRVVRHCDQNITGNRIICRGCVSRQYQYIDQLEADGIRINIVDGWNHQSLADGSLSGRISYTEWRIIYLSALSTVAEHVGISDFSSMMKDKSIRALIRGLVHSAGRFRISLRKINAHFDAIFLFNGRFSPNAAFLCGSGSNRCFAFDSISCRVHYARGSSVHSPNAFAMQAKKLVRLLGPEEVESLSRNFLEKKFSVRKFSLIIFPSNLRFMRRHVSALNFLYSLQLNMS